MTSDRDRFYDLLKEYSATAKTYAEKHKLLMACDPDSIEWNSIMEVVEKDFGPKLQKLSNELAHIILSSTQGKIKTLNMHDLAIGRRIMAETQELLKRANAGMPFR